MPRLSCLRRRPRGRPVARHRSATVAARSC